MTESVRVDFHLHSEASDGHDAPAVLAQRVAAAGVVYAALTDHGTVAGCAGFAEAFARAGGVAFTGMEVFATHAGREVHILALGFDAQHPAVARLTGPGPFPLPAVLTAIHDAGGLAVIAHPLALTNDLQALEELLRELQRQGADGIEALHNRYSPADQQLLLALADRLGLPVTGGSDFHAPGGGFRDEIGVPMTIDRWKRFRDALLRRQVPAARDHVPARSVPAPAESRLNLRLVLPVLTAIVLFLLMIFGLIVPAVEEALLARKREMIRELTNSAWSILAEYEREAAAGRLTRAQAQAAAVERIRYLRYGPDGKDYFWLTDMQPRMLMHPYRADLEGHDLSTFTDPQGTRLFVEFVQRVRAHESGYVEYVWQWKDDPSRLAAKESYVRGFRPWGWIIGTGIYVEDVQRDLQAINRRLIDLSASIVGLIGLLLLYSMYQSLRIDRSRRAAERDLRESHEKYRMLVESSAEGILMLAGTRCSYANQALLAMTGYDSRELLLLDVHDIFPAAAADDPVHAYISGVLRGEEPARPLETRMPVRGGAYRDIILTATPVTAGGNPGAILVIRATGDRRASEEQQQVIAEMQATMVFLNQPVGGSVQPLTRLPLTATVRTAAETLAGSGTGAVCIETPDGSIAGIVTHSDISRRVVAARAGDERPVTEIMTAPVRSADSSIPVFEAILLMREHRISHLLVHAAGRPSGVVRQTDLFRIDRYSPVVVLNEIRRAESVAAIAAARARLPGLVRTLFEAGMRPQHVTQLITEIADAVHVRVITLAERELGTPPGAYVFMVLGSGGRREQTLTADQDNAIIYEAADGQDTAAAYFVRLAETVCAGLAACGYARCKGGVMADNRKWNQPLTQWRQYVTGWLSEPSGNELIEFSIFFDMRAVHGESRLVAELQEHLFAELRHYPAFLFHLARTTLEYKVPLSMFGSIQTAVQGDAADSLNLKDALLTVVNAARYYALQHRIAETNTAERLQLLAAAGAVRADSVRELTHAFAFMMFLRLRHQTQALLEQRQPGNDVRLGELDRGEQNQLRQALGQVDTLQKKIRFESGSGT